MKPTTAKHIVTIPNVFPINCFNTAPRMTTIAEKTIPTICNIRIKPSLPGISLYLFSVSAADTPFFFFVFKLFVSCVDSIRSPDACWFGMYAPM